MTTLLVFLAIMAGGCDTVKVHRATPEQAQWCSSECNESGCGPCLQESHYVGAVVTEKCDTSWCMRDGWWVYDSLYNCHPETTVVDSGVITLYHAVPKPVSCDGLTIRYRPAIPPLDSAELADLREMLREWREQRRQERINKCIRDYQYRAMFDWNLNMSYEQVADSCECVYGRRKDGQK